MAQREFDIVLFGATGFTGRQAARYLAAHAPKSLRWAVAARNESRLSALDGSMPRIATDVTNSRQAYALAERTNVLISTAGPFALYSDALVAACIQAKTHYVDITGEVVWVRSLIERFHAQAERDGTRIVPFCGFDSVPADLGVFLLRKKLGPEMAEARAFFTVKGGRPNGGTIASAYQTYSSGANETGKDLFLLCPGVTRAVEPMEEDPTQAAFDAEVRVWTAPFPMSVIDTRVVRRSSALLGLDLQYQEYFGFDGVCGRLWANLASGGTRTFYAALQTEAIRKLLTRALQPGGGPSERSMDKGSFRCRMWGRTIQGETAEVVLAGTGDPANRITVQCVCEAAMAIACLSPNLPARGGVVTPSVGIGEALVERLRASGMQLT